MSAIEAIEMREVKRIKVKLVNHQLQFEGESAAAARGARENEPYKVLSIQRKTYDSIQRLFIIATRKRYEWRREGYEAAETAR